MARALLLHGSGSIGSPRSRSVVAVSGVLALLIGALSIRSRGIYFSMVTLAFAQLIYYVAFQASSWTGGGKTACAV